MKKREQILRFFESSMIADSDACVPWPFARSGSGYGQTWITGRAMGAHVYSCRKAHGPPPMKGLVVAHSCGVRLCINPHHLRWATYAENNFEAYLDGTSVRGEMHPLSTLTENDVREIRGLRGVVKQSILASKFKVSQAKISQIQLGKSWRHVDD